MNKQEQRKHDDELILSLVKNRAAFKEYFVSSIPMHTNASFPLIMEGEYWM